MLITLVLILLLIGAAVVGSIYSNFLVFYSNFNESENYHKAYYSSIAALERAELVIKQRSPGYVGSGGWILGHTNGEGTVNKGGSDGIIGNFSYLSNNDTSKNTSTVFRDINSRATRIPKAGNGDVEQTFAYRDSNNPDENSSNYNMMDYNYSQIFLLYYDKSTGNPYTKTKCKDTPSPCQQSDPKAIEGIIRLPKYLKTDFHFGDLNESASLVGNGRKDDAIVDWQIRGKYLNENSFTIYASQAKKSTEREEDMTNEDYSKDSTIREKHINAGLNFHFSKANKRSPTSDGNHAQLTMISPKENDIKSKLGCDITDSGCLNSNKFFETILTNTGDYTDKQLRFSLLNLLKTQDKKIYPFLEYYVEFQPNKPDEIVEISDKYFNIDAQGNYGDYKIDKIIWRPTSKESVLGSFTSIF